MPTPLLSKEEIVSRILTVFRKNGYDGASLSDFEHATGLGRSSLYHYFPGGKDEMAMAVLASLNAWTRERVIEPLRGGGSPQERVKKMIHELDELYAGGRDACVLGNLVVGGARTKFQAHLVKSFSAWVDALQAIAVEAGVPKKQARERAEDVVLTIQGALVLSGGLDDPSPFRRILRKIPQTLFG